MNATGRPLVIVLTVLAVILTATAISAVKHAQELNAQLEQTQAELQKVKGALAGKLAPGKGGMTQTLLSEETAANARLRKEIARLKYSSAAALVTNVTTVVTEVATNAPAAGRGGGPGAWMERIRQEDPERYKQLVADREQRRKDADNWYDTTQNQLAARAQAAASPDEADLATQISTTLSKLSDLRQQMQTLRELPDDQRQAQMAQLMPELQSTMQQLGQLREQDRTLQYQQLATQLGLTGAKAQTLATSIPEILKNTQYTPPGGGGGRGGGGGGGGFGGFGGPPPAASATPTTPAK